MAQVISLGYNPGNTILAKVSSSNVKGESLLSSESVLSIVAMQIPQVGVSSLTSISTSTYAQLSWNSISSPEDYGYSPITSYKISTWNATSSQFENEVSTQSTTYTFLGLIKGTTYTYKVVAENVFGPSLAFSTIDVKAADKPGQIARVELSMNVTKVVVSFDAPADDGGEPVDHYVIRFYDKNTAQFVEDIQICNGADSTIISSLECQVEMIALNQRFSYTGGNLI